MKFRALQHGFSISTLGTELSVRSVLSRLRGELGESGFDADLCSTVEIALAEALNNIVEHAYASDGPGPIDIVAQFENGGLRITLCDRGRALPNLELPTGTLPDARVALGDLPEGGFGWHLLHSLTESLSYNRVDGENRLILVFLPPH